MKKIIGISVLIWLCSTVCAQSVGKNQKRADSLFEIGEYEASKGYYATDAQLQPKTSAYYFYCQIKNAECAIRLNNLEEAQTIVYESLGVITTSFVLEKAWLQNIQAKIYYQKGLINQAVLEIKSAIESIPLQRFLNGEVLAECYNTEGLIYWISGNNEKALEYLNESLSIRKQEYGEESAEVAAVYNNIGLVFSATDLEEALQYYELAMGIYVEIYPSNHPALAIGYSNLGQLYHKQKVYNTALREYEKALAIWNERYANKHPNKAFVYSSMAQVYQEMDKTDLALEYAMEALEIYKEAYGEKHPNTAACYTLIAAIYTDTHDYINALTNLQFSLISNCYAFSNTDYNINPVMNEYFDGQLLLSTLTHKSIVLKHLASEKTLRIKEYKLALETYQSCDTLLDQLRQTRTSKNDKVALGVYSYDVYDKGIELCLFLGNNTANKEYYKRLAYYFIERSKSTVLQASIAESKAKTFAGIPNEELEKEDAYKTTITYLEQRLAKGITDKHVFKNISAELFETKRLYEAFILSLEKNYPAYYNLKYNVKPISIEDLQAKLTIGDCLLEYLVSDGTQSIYVFRITKKNFNIYSIPLASTYDKYITGLRNAIKFVNKELFVQTSTSLYNQLIPSIPKSSTHLIVIPDGRMGAIPFEALLRHAPKKSDTSYAEMDFLIKKYNVSYNYAGTLYGNIPESNARQNILLFAPVDFSAASDIPALPGTLKEVNAISELYGRDVHIDLFTHASATKDVLMSDSIRNYNIIHLATHGMVDEEEPDLSCIYTAGTSEENDRIYAGDMYNMQLKANLVTLSACQTGLGKYAKGEGLMGLSRALSYAGASNVIVSLWKVSDVSTQLYMQYFYTSCELSCGLTCVTNYAAASRMAKLKLLNSKEYNSPYYWSGFILIGK